MEALLLWPLPRGMKERWTDKNVSMEVKQGLRDSILLLTLMYGSGTWTWNRVLQSRVHAVVKSYWREICGVPR